MSDAAAVFAIYRFRPDVTDSTIADLLQRHRAVLEKSGLVTRKLPTVVKSMRSGGNRDFVEIFEWKDESAPSAAHSDPAVRQIWSEFEALTTVPAVALKDLGEANHPFPHFAPFDVAYRSAAATAPQANASRPKARPRVAPKRPASKSKRVAPRASKARARRRTAARR